jgi:hypothetical protein
MDDQDLRMRLRRELYLKTLRTSLASWRELKVSWLDFERRSRSEATMVEQAERAIAKCDAEIERLERLLADLSS